MSASFLQPSPTARLPDASSISATSSPDSPFRQRRHVVSSGKTEPPSHPNKRNELDTPAPRQDSRIAPTPVPCAARPGAGSTSRFRRAAGVTCRDRPSRVTVVVANAKKARTRPRDASSLSLPPRTGTTQQKNVVAVRPPPLLGAARARHARTGARHHPTPVAVPVAAPRAPRAS
jgi:hypothetical protein